MISLENESKHLETVIDINIIIIYKHVFIFVVLCLCLKVLVHHVSELEQQQ